MRDVRTMRKKAPRKAQRSGSASERADARVSTVAPWKTAAWLAALLLVILAGRFGWSRVARIPVAQVRVEGTVVADPDEIVRAARIDRDTLLVAVSPSLVDDRVRRHPWIREASTRRLPDGTVAVRVLERSPVLLALDASGRPEYFIDRDGFRMPFEPGHSFPVPLLRGFREPFHPVRPVDDRSIRALAATLPDLDPSTDALLSEFVVDESIGLLLVTTPDVSGRSLTVRLGRARYAERLARLRGYWNRAVLTRPDVRHTWIDLRFEGQIITKESS